MNLLVFAHRAEAKSFFSAGEFKQVSPNSPLHYGRIKNEELYLLITGEGIYPALTNLALALGQLQAKEGKEDKVKHIINYGVCGHLRDGFEIGKIYPIRQCYGQDEFHSFPAFTDQAAVDLITSKQRVLNSDHRSHLDNFAPLVDREGFGLCYAAKNAKTKISLYKLVSDDASSDQLCQMVKEKAPLWSDAMLSHYLRLGLDGVETNSHSQEFNLPFCSQSFHITMSQKRILTDLIKKLTLKNIDVAAIDVTDIIVQEVRPKEKTKLLIEKLHALLNPLHANIQKQLKEVSSPLMKQGIQVRFDNELEHQRFQINGFIEDQNHLQRVADTLSSFSFKQYLEIINGKSIDV